MKTIRTVCDKCNAESEVCHEKNYARPKDWVSIEARPQLWRDGANMTLFPTTLYLCPTCSEPLLPKEGGGFADGVESLLRDFIIDVLSDKGLLG